MLGAGGGSPARGGRGGGRGVIELGCPGNQILFLRKQVLLL